MREHKTPTGVKDENGEMIYDGDIVTYMVRSYGGFDTVWINVKAKVELYMGCYTAKTIEKDSDRMFNEKSGYTLSHTTKEKP